MNASEELVGLWLQVVKGYFIRNGVLPRKSRKEMDFLAIKPRENKYIWVEVSVPINPVGWVQWRDYKKMFPPDLEIAARQILGAAPEKWFVYGVVKGDGADRLLKMRKMGIKTVSFYKTVLPSLLTHLRKWSPDTARQFVLLYKVHRRIEKESEKRKSKEQ